MRKVHILTFHHAINYGAVLQCSALYQTMRLLGDCDVIDYHSPNIETAYQTFSKKASFKKNLRGLLTAGSTRKKRVKFDAFLREQVQLTRRFTHVDELKQAAWGHDDLFCVGSDQVWNLDLTNADTAFFLSFTPKTASRISYAASIGKELPDSEIHWFQEHLRIFQSISVRERLAKGRLRELQIECDQHLDPVYLLTKEEWERMSQPVPEEKESYVLVFLLQKSKAFMKKAEDYAKAQNKRLVVITAIEVLRKPGVRYITTCGPREFIRYLMKADVIFTNSFHGISLSILLNKTFFFEYLDARFKTNSRLQDVISLFQLEEQNAGCYETIPVTSIQQYAAINQRIEKERERSMMYLKKAMETSQ